MKGVEILLHSVRLVLNNLDSALRITLLPYLGVVALNMYSASLLAPFAQTQVIGTGPVPSAGLLFQVLIVAAAALIVTFWIAVAWHRYVLDGEVGTGYVPAWTGDRIAAYFGRSIVIGMLIGAVAVALSAILLPVLPTIFAGVIILFWVLVIFYRICAVLPAAAIGKDLTIAQAWNATKGQSGTIIVLSLVGGGVMLLLEAPNMMGGGDGLISILYSAVIGWFTMVIGASVLTTFYGHFVEDRPID